MKKTLLTVILPVVAILVGIGLVIGSFHAQTKTIPSHNPNAAQSVSPVSSAPDTSSSGKQKPQDRTSGKSKASDQQVSSATSSGSKGNSSTAPKTTGASASGTSAAAAGTNTSAGTTQVKASGNKTTSGAASHSHAASASSSQPGTGTSSASSGASSKQSSVSVSIHGLNSFNASGSAAYRSSDSAFSELQRFTQAKGIQFSYSGFGSSIYVSSINNQKAGQVSPTSGWTYSVNGKAPNISAGAYHTKPGDRISWYYTK